MSKSIKHLSLTQKAALIDMSKRVSMLGAPRKATAVSLVRQGYANWYDMKRGIIVLTTAGLRFAKYGILI